jgi:hypothetical protein
VTHCGIERFQPLAVASRGRMQASHRPASVLPTPSWALSMPRPSPCFCVLPHTHLRILTSYPQASPTPLSFSPPAQSRVPNLSTMDIWGQIILGGGPVLCRMLNSVPGCHPPGDRSTKSPTLGKPEKYPAIVSVLRGQSHC